jgi:hypothetical protein
MPPKPTIIHNIVTQWDEQEKGDHSNLTAPAWEQGIQDTLNALYFMPPYVTSRIIVDAFVGTGRKATIKPFPKRSFKDPKTGELIAANADAEASDRQAATQRGKKTEPDKYTGQSGVGTGQGSDEVIGFVAQDFDSPSSGTSMDPADEALFHELVHAWRSAIGMDSGDQKVVPPGPLYARGDLDKPNPHSQDYQNFEEFVAVLITNIYRSECGRSGLVRDHAGIHRLFHPLTNARNFLSLWRTQVDQLCREALSVCNQLAQVNCSFNPIFELYQDQGRFLPGGRALR